MTSEPSDTEDSFKPGTRERLLDVAERVFAERGFACASVRDITDAAGANLGAINYHFQSKDNLYVEVFRRRLARIQEQFLAGLRDNKAVTEGALEEALAVVAKAFVSPHTDREHSRRFLDLCSREMIEARLPAGLFVREFVTPVIETMMGLIGRARPELDEGGQRHCAHSFLAQLLHVVKGVTVAGHPSCAGVSVPPVEDQLAHVVRFTAAAIRHI